MNNNLEVEDENLYQEEMSPRTNYGAGYGNPLPTKEYILCAAIWYKELDKLSPKWDTLLRPVNIDRGIVLCGYRHPHCMYQMIAITGKRSVSTDCGEYSQGFLTSLNRFVNRQEGAQIHIANGHKLNYSKRDLFSEDLY